MHVAMFSDTYFPYISGVVRSIERLSDALRSRGHQVTVFGPHYWGYSDVTNSGVCRCASIPLYPPANIVLALPQVSAIRDTLKSTGVDLIHSHSPFIMGKTAVKLGHQLGLPVVFSHHSVYHEYAVYAPKPLRGTAEKVIINWLKDYVNSVDAVIAPSVGTQSFIKAAYGADSTVISNPIADPVPGGDIDAPALSEPVLLFVGRLGKEKNLPLLLRAFALVQKEHSARLVLVGDGPERGNIERLANDLGIWHKVEITGFLSYAEVSKRFRQATLFTFPSYNETQGMVILEALAHSVPVVTVESEASRAVLDACNCGRITSAEPGEMAQAISDLLSAPEHLPVLGESGRLFAQRFSADGVAEQMEQLYSRLVSKSLCAR